MCTTRMDGGHTRTDLLSPAPGPTLAHQISLRGGRCRGHISTTHGGARHHHDADHIQAKHGHHYVHDARGSIKNATDAYAKAGPDGILELHRAFVNAIRRGPKETYPEYLADHVEAELKSRRQQLPPGASKERIIELVGIVKWAIQFDSLETTHRQMWSFMHSRGGSSSNRSDRQANDDKKKLEDELKKARSELKDQRNVCEQLRDSNKKLKESGNTDIRSRSLQMNRPTTKAWMLATMATLARTKRWTWHPRQPSRTTRFIRPSTTTTHAAVHRRVRSARGRCDGRVDRKHAE